MCARYLTHSLHCLKLCPKSINLLLLLPPNIYAQWNSLKSIYFVIKCKKRCFLHLIAALAFSQLFCGNIFFIKLVAFNSAKLIRIRPVQEKSIIKNTDYNTTHIFIYKKNEQMSFHTYFNKPRQVDPNHRFWPWYKYFVEICFFFVNVIEGWIL